MMSRWAEAHRDRSRKQPPRVIIPCYSDYSGGRMASTKRVGNAVHQRFDWRNQGLRYYAYNFHLRRLFGHRVQRVSVDAGFTCPNVDGTLATGGCTFCDNRSFSPSRRLPRTAIRDQIDEGIRRLQLRYKCQHFMAYFQPATNTYAPVDRLRDVFRQAVDHPSIMALAIGTRSDCVPDEVLDLLSELAEQTPLSVEYGMQTMHNRSLRWMNRCEEHEDTIDAVERSRGRGFEIGVHIMLGLPGESLQDMLATANEVARLKVDAVKIHNLYAVEGTPLADQVRQGTVTLMERDEYVSTLVDFLERLPESVVVERISGEAPPRWFVGPAWAQDKPGILTAVEQELVRRDSWQGKYHESGGRDA